MYVHGVSMQQTKRVRAFSRGQMGLDKVCIETDWSALAYADARAYFPEMER